MKNVISLKVRILGSNLFLTRLYRVIRVARSLETLRFPKIVLIRKLVADYGRLLQVQKGYFQNGETSRNTGNGRHLCFF
jgi:hypothetical protein